MKQIWKRIYRLALLALGVCMCAALPAAAEAKDDVNESLRASMINTAEGLSKTIMGLSQKEIDAYKESGDEFTVMAMEAWESSREELGKFKSLGKPKIEAISDGYSLKIPGEFSKYEAQFVYLFDETGAPTSFSIDVQYPMSVLLQRAGMNTLMGMGIVFAMLIFLTFVISMFRFIGQAGEKTQKEEERSVPVQAQRRKLAAAAVPQQDDGELVAVIAAAIAAYEGTSTDSFVVRSIRKANRKKEKW